MTNKILEKQMDLVGLQISQFDAMANYMKKWVEIQELRKEMEEIETEHPWIKTEWQKIMAGGGKR